MKSHTDTTAKSDRITVRARGYLGDLSPFYLQRARESWGSRNCQRERVKYLLQERGYTVTDKATVELSVDEIDLLVGALGAFLAESESWLNRYQTKTDTTEHTDYSFFAQLSENIQATELLGKLGKFIGWTDSNVLEFLEIIQRETKEN